MVNFPGFYIKKSANLYPLNDLSGGTSHLAERKFDQTTTFSDVFVITVWSLIGFVWDPKKPQLLWEKTNHFWVLLNFGLPLKSSGTLSIISSKDNGYRKT